ncbi:ATP-binding protein [Acetonema longum]|uniref:Anti-sigma regulatory factor n=1 Tax=Acetonema longum DSM 6540 TaxID=1009370 RepID=F7NHM6_9FIRM|nr:anti-sigma regulatory factor [Acetonema longum]EGO64401.1 anti-sigma regulatory factor [Acetonema longum DSM 6540]
MKADAGLSLEFTLHGADFELAGAASSKIKRILQQVGVKSDVIRRIAISSYEAEMNVIIHAYHGEMRVSIYPNRTEITIEDEGPGIPDIKLAMQEGYSTASDHIRELGFGAGMGLPNIARCCDAFEITSEVGKGTRIYMMILH